jgi:protein SCO1/2
VILLGACGQQDEGRAEPGAAADTGALRAPAVDDVRVIDVDMPEVPDEELFDQDGASVRLSDRARDRTVVVNFVFTTCTTVCSPMTAIFARLQTELGEAMERDVRLVSISLDPGADTPEQLKRYADRFDRREGWTFLTGRSDRVASVLKALGGYAGAKERHTPLTLIGSNGRWRRVEGLAGPERLAEEVRALHAARSVARH